MSVVYCQLLLGARALVESIFCAGRWFIRFFPDEQEINTLHVLYTESHFKREMMNRLTYAGCPYSAAVGARETDDGSCASVCVGTCS